MSDPVSTIRNLGRAAEASFARAGIHNAAELRELGADAAYERLLASGQRPHFIGYYALALGLMGRPWTDCEAAEKAALRKRFDAIVARRHSTAPPAGIEQALDRIGLPDRRR